ncbi:hypothetical protein ACJBTR_10615, partial [Streptococcus suis]
FFEIFYEGLLVVGFFLSYFFFFAAGVGFVLILPFLVGILVHNFIFFFGSSVCVSTGVAVFSLL